jgi:1,4-alpha-glucan branching enzyme
MAFERELGVPAPGAQKVWARFNKQPRTGDFKPDSWMEFPLTSKGDGWWVLDIPSCQLADGTYEYEFRFAFGSEGKVAADPFAEEITKHCGYRALMSIQNGMRRRVGFSWNDELPPGVRLPGNNEMVIYELPMRWMDAPADAASRNIGMGTFEKALYEHLRYIRDLGINAIELLPVQDSPDSINWGYGTRFFFAPDFDMGTPYDLKLFIKQCHRQGIRVILDVVMNHARGCPLRDIAYEWYFGSEGDRNAWGGDLFLFNHEVRPGYRPARQWHFDHATYWIQEYHVDGFRIDEFKGIDNWDFLREFRNHAWSAHQSAFPGRPFIVIAEDSARRPEATQGLASGGKVVDAIWDFDSRDEFRRLCSNTLVTRYGKPSRTERAKALLSGRAVIDGENWREMWNDQEKKKVPASFSDLAQRIVYITSHDVQETIEQRLYGFLSDILKWSFGEDWTELRLAETQPLAIEQMFTAFALMLTSAGIPMFLAGEEFADLHDISHYDWRQKMSDPVNWNRLRIPAHGQLTERVCPVIKLRTTHPALQRNEIQFLHFHPRFDNNDSERVFSYCRSGGMGAGVARQVLVVANCGPQAYPNGYGLPWPWTGPSSEVGGIGQSIPVALNGWAQAVLKPFQTRVFHFH